MPLAPRDQYRSLMEIVRTRFDVIAALKLSGLDKFSRAELCAFHGRKIIEGVAFGCLVALENGIKHVPRDAQGQWSADSILSSLESKKLDVFPSPSQIRLPTGEEKASYGELKATVEGKPERRISREALKSIYRELHKWLHEINPYVGTDRENFLQKHEEGLWDDLQRMEMFIERHTISINGEMFFCVLRDKNDGRTKVVLLSKVASLYS